MEIRVYVLIRNANLLYFDASCSLILAEDFHRLLLRLLSQSVSTPAHAIRFSIQRRGYGRYPPKRSPARESERTVQNKVKHSIAGRECVADHSVCSQRFPKEEVETARKSCCASSSPQCYPYHHQLCSVIYIPVSIVSATVKSCGLLLICQSSSGLVLFVLLSGLGLCKTDIRNFQEQQGLELVVKDFRFLHSSPSHCPLLPFLVYVEIH